MVSGTRDNPPPEATLLSVYMYMGKRSSCRPSHIHNPYCIFKSAVIPLSLSFPRSFDGRGFCRVKFHFLIRISALLPKSWHFVVLVTPRVVPIRVFTRYKKSCPACQGYPTCRGSWLYFAEK